MLMMKTQVEEDFSEYYEKWVIQLQEIHHQLLSFSSSSSSSSPPPSSTPNPLTTNPAFANADHRHAEGAGETMAPPPQPPPPPPELEALLSRTTALHKDFYTVKWAAAHEDVLAFFAPVWLSPLEHAHLWFTGWKPSLVFRLLRGASRMTEEQARSIGRLRSRIRVEEERVERQMEGQQVGLAANRGMIGLLRLARGGGGEASATTATAFSGEGAVRGLMAGLEKVVKSADCVRLKTLKGVLDVLSPCQRVDFLVGTCMLHIELREWGQKEKVMSKLDDNASDTKPMWFGIVKEEVTQPMWFGIVGKEVSSPM